MNNQATGKNDEVLEWVQMLRGVAAFLVVLTHARMGLFNTPEQALSDRILLPGAMGVDLFFILSGFIIYYSTRNAEGGVEYATRFAIKRFARVWPVYAVVTLLYVMQTGKGLNFFHSTEHLLTLAKSLVFFPPQPDAVPYFGVSLPVGWTLDYEMYFYVIFALSLLYVRMRLFLLLAWVALTVVLIPWGDHGLAFDVGIGMAPPAGYLNIVASPFVLEFLAGVLIARLYLLERFRIASPYLAWHVLGLSVCFVLWLIYGCIPAGYSGPLYGGWPMAILVTALALTSKTITLRPPRFVLWLGAISYSLYVTHFIAQNLVIGALERAKLEALHHTWGFIFISTAVSLCLGSLAHHYLEVRLSRVVRKGLLRLCFGPAATVAKIASDPVSALSPALYADKEA